MNNWCICWFSRIYLVLVIFPSRLYAFFKYYGFIVYICNKGGSFPFRTGAVRMNCIIHNSMNSLHMTVSTETCGRNNEKVWLCRPNLCLYIPTLRSNHSCALTRWNVSHTPVLRISNSIYNILSKFKHILYQVIQLKSDCIHSQGKWLHSNDSIYTRNIPSTCTWFYQGVPL
jgi:hypothetical protein